MAASRLRRLLRFVVRSVVGLAVLVVAAYLLRGPLFGGLLRGRLERELSDAAGRRVTIGRVEGGWLADLTLVDVDTPDLAADGPVRRARADRVTVRYRLLDLLDDPLAGLDDVDVGGVEVFVRVVPGPEDAPPADIEGTLADLLRDVPRDLPRIRVAGHVEVEGDALRVATDVVAERPRQGEVDARLSGLVVELGERRFAQDTVHVVLRRDADALRLDAPVALGGVEVRALRAERVDGGARVVGSFGVGGDVEVELRDATLRAGLRGIDARALPPLVRDVTGLPDNVPPVVLDADVELGWREALPLAVRNVTVSLGDATLTLAELRADDAAEPSSYSWTQLAVRVPDVAWLAEALSVELPVAPPPGGPTSLALHSPLGYRRAASIEELVVATPRSRVRVTGRTGLPYFLDDWDAVEVALDGEATLDAAEAATYAPEEWKLPEIVGTLDVSGSAEGMLSMLSGSLRAGADGLTLAERLVHRLDVEAELDGDQLTVARLLAHTELGRIDARGSVDLIDGTLTDAAFDVEIPDLDVIARAFEALPELAGSLSASGLLTGSLQPDPKLPADGFPDDVRAAAHVDAAGLVIDGAHLGDVTASVTLSGPRLDVERVRVDGALGRLEASGSAHLVERSVTVPGFAFAAPDLGTLSRWVPVLASTEGAVEADGAVTLLPGESWRDARIGLSARAPRLQVPGADLREVVLRVDADDGRVALHEAVATTPWGTVRAVGTLGVEGETVTATLTSAEADLDRAVLGLDGGTLPVRLRAPVDVAWHAERLEVRGLDADVLDGRVRGDLSRGADASLEAAFEDLDLARLADEATGRLSGTISLTGDPEHPAGTVTARVPALTWRGESGAVEIDARQDEDGVHIARCEISAGGLLKASAEGYAPFVVGESGARRITGRRATLRLDARSETPDAWLSRFAPTEIHASAAAVSADAAGPLLNAELSVRDLSWREEDGTTPVQLPGETVVRLAAGQDGSTAEIHGGAGGPLSVDGTVTVAGPVDWRDPFGSLERLPDAALGGSLRVSVPSLSQVATWFPELRRVDGSAAVDVTLSGTVEAPDWRGELAVDDVAVAALDDIPPIDRGRLRATLRGRTLEIDECEVRLGYAPVTVSGSVTVGDDREPVFDIRAVGSDVQVVRTQFTRVRADVDVRVSGPASVLLLSGEARVTDAWYTKPVAAATRGAGEQSKDFQLFSATSEPFASLRFDVHATADDTIRVDTNVVSGTLSMDMQLRGSGAVPQPEGRLWCRDILVRLPVTRLFVEAATITFPPERPFDPDLRLAGFSRVRGYDLDVQISGGASDMRVLIAASPPLTQEEALLLLATGAPPKATGTGGQVGTTAAAGGAAALGEAALGWLSGPRTAGEERFADRVDIFVGREVSESGIATIEAEVQLFPGWYLRFERDRWEDYAAGVFWRVRFR